MKLKLLEGFYICCSCHKVFDQTYEIYTYLEENKRPFCSVKCLENYYSPLIKKLEEEEGLTRKAMNHNDTLGPILLRDPLFLKHALSQSSEIHQIDNGLGDLITIIFSWFDWSNFGKVGTVVYSIRENDKDVLILHAIVDQKENFLESFLPEAENKNSSESVYIDQEMVASIELKKSTFMAALLEQRTAMDIPYEEFAYYEPYIGPTLERADEVFVEKDQEGDQVFKFFKACNKEGKNFYFVVFGVIVSADETTENETVIPILSFPTIDADLYRYFRTGEQLSGFSRN